MRMITVAALLAALHSPPSHALVFDFFWSADPAANPTIVSATDPTAQATGTVEIDALAGESFTPFDIIALDITASGAGGSFTFDQPINALGFTGTIAADGLSASLTDFFLAAPFESFGCDIDCAPVFGADVIFSIGTAFDGVDYIDQASTQASFVLTAPAVVPLPASLPLALAGALALGFVARRRQDTQRKL